MTNDKQTIYRKRPPTKRSATSWTRMPGSWCCPGPAWMTHFFMQDRARKAMVMRAIKNDVGGQDQTFVKKVMEHFFDGRIIGRLYRNQPRG